MKEYKIEFKSLIKETKSVFACNSVLFGNTVPLSPVLFQKVSKSG